MVLDLFVLGICSLFYKQLLAICFDEEFARLRGVPVEFYYLLLLCLTALTVVLLTTVVGIILVIALLTLPAAIAGLFSRTLLQMMIWGSFLCSAFTILLLWRQQAFYCPYKRGADKHYCWIHRNSSYCIRIG